MKRHTTNTSRILTDCDRENLFYQFIKMARSQAQRFARAYGRSYDELRDEAESILAEKVADWENQYDPSRAGPSTWIYQCLYHELMSYCTRRMKPMRVFSDIFEDGVPDIFQQRPCPIQSLLRNLSDEGRELVNTIINAPGEIIGDMAVATRGRARQAVKEFMLHNRNWSIDQLHSTWNEVEECLSDPN